MARGNGILPGYRGHVDCVEPILAGWVSELARPLRPVHLAVTIDRDHRLPLIADRPREDVVAAGLAAANCGFALVLPPSLLDGVVHAIGLRLMDGRSLNLPGLPPRVALGPVRADLISHQTASSEAVLALLRHTDAEAGFAPDRVHPEHAAHFNALQSPGQGFLFYARAAGELVGYGRLDRGRGEAAGLGVVALTVLEAYRRKGLGEALLRRLLGAAVAAGMRQVWLSVRPDNLPALRLYEKLGFVRDAKRPSGRWAIPGELTMVWLPRLAGRR